MILDEWSIRVVGDNWVVTGGVRFDIVKMPADYENQVLANGFDELKFKPTHKQQTLIDPNTQ